MATELRPTDRAEHDRQLGDLLALSARGDQNAFGALYDAVSPAVFGLALRILRDRAEAEEVVLDVFLQVWRQASRFDSLRGSAITWILVLTRSRAIDRLRSIRAERAHACPLLPERDVESGAAGPAGESWIAQQSRMVRAALAELPPEQRLALELAHFEGLTHVEIAERLREPVGTIKTRIRLGMCKLRDALGPRLAAGGLEL